MSDVIFREARARDIASIVALLADDELGRNREELAGLEGYSLAFGQIEGDANNCILVGERQCVVIACLQLSFIRGLSRKGAMRALIEGVRVASSERRSGVGASLMRHAIGIAREAGCTLVQLTSDKRRDRAHSFYRELGFVDTHEGFKLELAP